MKSNYKIIVSITLLLLILSVGISTVNYMVSLSSTQAQLKQQSLPLSLDNIYTEIQKQITVPYLVSSMMANDTFVNDWIISDEDNRDKIIKYLEAIKNKYKMSIAFLVSEKSKSYYSHKGFIEQIKPDAQDNKWYFNFKDIAEHQEINMDFNKNLANSLIMFINFKIFDKNSNFLGATGVGLEISYIDAMLKMFREKYNFRVYFFNKNGKIVLSEHKNNKNISEIRELALYKERIFSKNTNTVEYELDGNEYILTTKYVPELDLFIAVEAQLSDFTKDVRRILYFNLMASLLITIIVAFVIVTIIKHHNKKLEYLADTDTLTKISNRRSLGERFEYFLLLNKRNQHQLSLLFLDIDNFKSINDTYGHEKGDFILNRCATILQSSIRKTDLLGRWGGEEFVVVFVDTSIEEAKMLAEKIRSAFENDPEMQKAVGANVTASFGLTLCDESDSTDSAIARADSAMYKAKTSGKNQVATALLSE